jgi:hypothetical protein
MPGRWKQIRTIIIILALFGCSLACLVALAPILVSNAMTMTIGGLSVGSDAASGGQMTTSNTQRLPQIPLDVEHYHVAPHGLELEQVHVFVRHGESSDFPRVQVPGSGEV